MTALNEVGIGEHARERASNLSGGQQQRAALARARNRTLDDRGSLFVVSPGRGLRARDDPSDIGIDSVGCGPWIGGAPLFRFEPARVGADQ